MAHGKDVDSNPAISIGQAADAESLPLAKISIGSIPDSKNFSVSTIEIRKNGDDESRVFSPDSNAGSVSEVEPRDVAVVESGPAPGEVKRPEGMTLFLLTTGMMFSAFIMSLDKSIIATAIPRISTEFHSIDDIGWYTSAYLLPIMALQPTFGKIYKHFDIKSVFLCALVGSELGSIICATSRSSPVFILGRVISGASAGAIQSGGMVIIGLTIPLHKVSLFLGTLTSMTAVAGLTGPPLGGLFTDVPRLTWRFCFWINLPFGGIAAMIFLLGFRSPVMKPSELTFKQKLVEMDLPGTALFVSSMTSLFLALQWGGTSYAWSNSKVWGLILGSGLLFAAFIVLQIHLGERATIPLRIFRNRSLSFSLLASALLYLATTVHTFYLPFYFQSAKGTSAAASGLRMLPYIVSLSVTQLAVGSAVTAIGVFFCHSCGVVLQSLPLVLACSLLSTPTRGLLLRLATRY